MVRPDTSLSFLTMVFLRLKQGENMAKKEEDEFEELWRVVDKKSAKQQARKAFKKNYKYFKAFCLQHSKSFAEIYVFWKQGEYKSRGFLNDDGVLDKAKLQFLCHLSTWLNGHRWEDEHYIPEPEEKDLWFNSSTGIIKMGEMLGFHYVEDEEPFPVFKQKVFKKYKSKYGSLRGGGDGIFFTQH